MEGRELLLPVSDQRHRSQKGDGHRDGSEFPLTRVSASLWSPDTQKHSPPQMLSLMEAQSQFFQHGHQSLSELDQYRHKLSEEAGLLFLFFQFRKQSPEQKRLREAGKVLRGPGVSPPGQVNTAVVARLSGMCTRARTRVHT